MLLSESSEGSLSGNLKWYAEQHDVAHILTACVDIDPIHSNHSLKSDVVVMNRPDFTRIECN